MLERHRNKISENSPNIHTLVLANGNITDKDIIELVTLLKKNDYITTLELSWNSISDAGAKLLAQYARERFDESKINPQRKPLLKVDLDKNPRLRDEGAIALIDSPISCLIISRASITEKTAEYALKNATQTELTFEPFFTPKELLAQVENRIANNRTLVLANLR